MTCDIEGVYTLNSELGNVHLVRSCEQHEQGNLPGLPISRVIVLEDDSVAFFPVYIRRIDYIFL